MTVEKFFETLKLAVDLDRELGIQESLNSIRDHLTNIVNAPAQPQYQSALAGALSGLSNGVAELKVRLTPSQLGAINEVAGQQFFDLDMEKEIKESIAANALTPTVARQFVQDLTAQRNNVLDRMQRTLAGMTELGITTSLLKPGDADVAFVIPPEIFDGKLGSFAKELAFITRLVEDYGEALTGAHEPVVLKGLSSSTPLVLLVAAPPVILFLANLVNKFLDAWEKIERIRKIRAELSDMGIKGPPIEVLDKQIKETVRNLVDDSVKDALAKYAGESERRNELSTALGKETLKLFAQIEKGLTVQFRAEPTEDGTDKEKVPLKAISQLSHQIKFPPVQSGALLLGDGETNDLEEKQVDGTEKDHPKAKTSKRRVRAAQTEA